MPGSTFLLVFFSVLFYISFLYRDTPFVSCADSRGWGQIFLVIYAFLLLIFSIITIWHVITQPHVGLHYKLLLSLVLLLAPLLLCWITTKMPNGTEDRKILFWNAFLYHIVLSAFWTLVVFCASLYKAPAFYFWLPGVIFTTICPVYYRYKWGKSFLKSNR